MTAQPSVTAGIQCPECGAVRVYKDGVRHTVSGDVQRFVCRECGYRFSDPSSLKVKDNNRGSSQICAFKVKNLDTLETKQSSAGELNTAKGEILSYLFHMKKQGLAASTIENASMKLTQMSKRCNLNDPESVKEFLCNSELKPNSKANYTVTYGSFLKFLGKTWTPPKYTFQQTIPFIPLETEIDQLISGCGKSTATTLQLLKETGMRIGEALRLKWTDINPENNTVTLNDTEKHGKPRMFKVSSKLIGMLQSLPKKNARIFGKARVTHRAAAFKIQRLGIAKKVGNPRLEKITFHTLRHWKGTIEYHKTHDPDHVKRLLGHRNLQSTEIYINMEQAVFSESDQSYHSATASTVQEAQKLIEQGFEFVCGMDNAMLFRKRK